MAMEHLDDVFAHSFSRDVQESEQVCGFFMGCLVVLYHSIELAVKHGPQHKSIEHQWLYPIHIGRCIPVPSIPLLSFDFHDLYSEFQFCGFYEHLRHLYVQLCPWDHNV
jgi:hypothetical protein